MKEDNKINKIDVFTRSQIIEYLDRIPLGYVTDRDHEVLERFVNRCKAAFSELSTKWSPSND